MSNKPFSPIYTLLMGLAFWAVIAVGVIAAGGCKTVYDAPVTATLNTFQEDISEYDMTVIVFWADWCPACLVLNPNLDQLAKLYAGQMKVVKVNIDETNPVFLGYDFKYIPYIVVLNEGRQVFSGLLEDDDHLNRIVAKELGAK